MKGERYSVSRQKACDQCSRAKVRCDRRTGGCTRCSHRFLTCHYTANIKASPNQVENVVGENGPQIYSINSPGGGILTSPEQTNESILSHEGNLGPYRLQTSPSQIHKQDLTSTKSFHLHGHTVPHGPTERRCSFEEMELICPINAEDIQNRWLVPFISVSNHPTKQYPTGVMVFMSRVLKSYASMAVSDRGYPPFVHSKQLQDPTTCPQLSTCFGLIRICEKPFPGSETLATDIVRREMDRLYQSYGAYDPIQLLATFQAYLIYAMALHFLVESVPPKLLREAMINLQELACATARQGLVCTAEQNLSRPRWEMWIVAEAKRRTLYTMYMFDSVLSDQDGMPNYLGVELTGLPAPGVRALWQAQSREEWEKSYNTHLADWPDKALRIDELWPVPVGFSKDDIKERHRRLDRWLEAVDEYGTMLFAVTSCTHGC